MVLTLLQSISFCNFWFLLSRDYHFVIVNNHFVSGNCFAMTSIASIELVGLFQDDWCNLPKQYDLKNLRFCLVKTEMLFYSNRN